MLNMLLYNHIQSLNTVNIQLNLILTLFIKVNESIFLIVILSIICGSYLNCHYNIDKMLLEKVDFDTGTEINSKMNNNGIV